MEIHGKQKCSIQGVKSVPHRIGNISLVVYVALSIQLTVPLLTRCKIIGHACSVQETECLSNLTKCSIKPDFACETSSLCKSHPHHWDLLHSRVNERPCQLWTEALQSLGFTSIILYCIFLWKTSRFREWTWSWYLTMQLSLEMQSCEQFAKSGPCCCMEKTSNWVGYERQQNKFWHVFNLRLTRTIKNWHQTSKLASFY